VIRNNIWGNSDMNRFKVLFLAVLVFFVTLGIFGCGEFAGPGVMKVVASEQGLEVLEGAEKILFYQLKAKNLEGKLERLNYIHPLYNLDGDIITEDFPADHLHHRGIFWAWHQLYIGDKSVGDGWALTDFSQEVVSSKVVELGSASAAVKVVVLWKSPLWVDQSGVEKAFVKVSTIVRVHRAADDVRMIDFQISLLGLEEDMSIGGSENVKGYGGFSTRIKLKDGYNFVGQIGQVEPVTNQVAGGGWMDISGRYGEDEKLSGIAILCHKSNPVYPSRWILRRKGSCQNVVYPGQHRVALSNREPTVLRYRLVLHRGDVSVLDLDGILAEYNLKGYSAGFYKD